LNGIKVASLKLFLEYYFDNCINVFLALIGILQFVNNENIYWSNLTTGDWFNVSLSLSCTIGIFVFPLFAKRVIDRQFQILEKKSVKSEYGYLYEGISTSNIMQAHFNTFFMYRRWLTSVVLIYMTDIPFFQCHFLMIFATIDMIYLVTYMPHDTY